MNEKKFESVAMTKKHENWEHCIKREKNIDIKAGDVRTEFFRDYTRILHSTAYRRLKNKTQVFYAPSNDHICTRIEHVGHVASVSYIIAKTLGLNTELTNAIATGHDLGHAPFGHWGETILCQIAENNSLEKFWHERNSLRFVDKIETLPNQHGKENNLNLTYAVRDGIVCHCGEKTQQCLKPRTNNIELYAIIKAGGMEASTWEGCVVKISDKIAYLGRDIEDAYLYKILSKAQLNQLAKLNNDVIEKQKSIEVNNTIIIHKLIDDLCNNSSPDSGLIFSNEYFQMLNNVQDFCSNYIYKHPKIETYKKYIKLILKSIFSELANNYDSMNTLKKLKLKEGFYPILVYYFTIWLQKYSDINKRSNKNNVYENEILYNLENEIEYKQAIIDFISGMTDKFTIKIFNEIISF